MSQLIGTAIDRSKKYSLIDYSISPILKMTHRLLAGCFGITVLKRTRYSGSVVQVMLSPFSSCRKAFGRIGMAFSEPNFTLLVTVPLSPNLNLESTTDKF